jgi:glycosyltransferase involved in cell wall biosynthesis
VATDVPGCREICIDGVTGLRVPSHAVDELAEALLRMLDDAPLARACAQAARAKVEREFTLERIADETLALYQQLSQRP